MGQYWGPSRPKTIENTQKHVKQKNVRFRTYPFEGSQTGSRADPPALGSREAALGSALRPARSTGKKKCDRQSDGALICIFPPDLARPGALGTLPGRSEARFSRPKRQFRRRLSLRVCTLLHDLLTLTKHCVGARISSFGLVARVPTSGENSLRTLLGEGLALATRSTRARKQPKRANLALEIANLAPRTADKAAKTANLAAKTAQLGVPRPFQTRLGASPSRSRAPKIKISSIFHQFF